MTPEKEQVDHMKSLFKYVHFRVEPSHPGCSHCQLRSFTV